MTANNSSPADLSPSRALGLLQTLAATAATAAAAEDAILKESRLRRLTLERRHHEALAALELQRSQAAAALDATWLQRWNHTRHLRESRHLRIEKAERHSLRDLPRRTEAARAHWLGGLQRQRLSQERALLNQSDQALEPYQARAERLAAAQASLERLRRRAHQAFQGSPGFAPYLAAPAAATPEDPAAALAAAEAQLPILAEQLHAYRQRPLPRFFSILSPPVLLVLIFAGALILAGALGFDPSAFRAAALAALVGLLALAALYGFAFRAARPAAAALAAALSQAIASCALLQQQAQSAQETELSRRKTAQDRIADDIQSQWGGVSEIDTDFAAAAHQKIALQVPRLTARNEARLQAQRDLLEAAHAAESDACATSCHARRDALLALQTTESAEAAEAASTRSDALAASWAAAVPPLCAALQDLRQAAPALAPPWPLLTAATWSPPTSLPSALPFATLAVDLAAHAAALPRSPHLALPIPPIFDLPLALAFPNQGSLLLSSHSTAQGPPADLLHNLILRLLAASRPGQASFTILDPVGLGQNFAGLMPLADYEHSLINHRIWTQREHIDERLGILCAHIEKVIQMYLRNEFSNIAEYNSQADAVAEKYHYLVVADFPANFSETALKRLDSILASGPRCGVFTLLHSDLRAAPTPFSPSPQNLALHRAADCWELPGRSMVGLALLPESPPPPPHALALLHRIGQASIDAGRVEVPFTQIAPTPPLYWTGDSSQELRVPIGRSGAAKPQILAIGKGTRQHALFAGKTGSGKSTLFHVIITNLALTFSPDQVEFYLIDFKKGVEFKCYAHKKLPHARVVAIESDRAFALSVLQRLDEELKRRGDLFRQHSAQDLPGYLRSPGAQPLPRSLLIIDEFQEFFVEDDPIAQTASLLLDRIVRQGRAFGIHVLLGSQTLGGAYSLARATLGQMSIRVALQCNEADAYLIMDDNNPAPRLLSRPGEGIYNDAAGSLEGNSPFQVVWLPDRERDRLLDAVLARAAADPTPPRAPLVFEGNAPANLLDNPLLTQALAAPPLAPPPSGRCWLGAPNAIKGPTEAVFRRQSGHHLLVVGQREDASLTLLSLALLALAAQAPPAAAHFYLFHSASPDSPEAAAIDQLAAALPALHLVRPHQATSAIADLAQELQNRAADGHPSAPPIYILIHGLHRFKKLRPDDDFSFSMDRESGPNPSAQFLELIAEGSSLGLHLLVSLDTFNNLNRSLSRKALTEFEMRVVFQMSANDSASLIDSPAASQLGLHRALFYNEHDGTLETFRPYAPPSSTWLAQTAARLAPRHPAPA